MAAIELHVHLELDEIVERLKADGWVPVVRCKDCKYGSRCLLSNIQCKIYDRIHEPDWFCAGGEQKSHGERKGGDV